VARELCITRAAAATTCCRCTCARATWDKTEHRHELADCQRGLGRSPLASPLDLERFMSWPRADFNMGDVENKALTSSTPAKYVLICHCNRHRLSNIESVVGHEYFLQLDWQPCHLPRLVPAELKERPHRLPRPGIQHMTCAPSPPRGQGIEDVCSCAPEAAHENAQRHRTTFVTVKQHPPS
jgi:hypothetical protein